MFEEINKELMEVKEKMELKSNLQKKLNSAKQTLKNEKEKLNELEEAIVKEENDVKNLEKVNLQNLFYCLIGSKDKKIEKEQQEAVFARLKYNECKNYISILEEDISRLDRELDQFINIDYRYNEIIRRKEEEIIYAETEDTRRMTKLHEKVGRLRAQHKEIGEALNIGKKVESLMDKLIECLNNAEDWGSIDILGGGLISTSVKHSYIDEANDYVCKIQELLKSFNRELIDVELELDENIDISEFEKFSDYFFDGFVSDWIVQSKISESLQVAKDSRNKVASIVNVLKKKEKDNNESITWSKLEIMSLIENV